MKLHKVATGCALMLVLAGFGATQSLAAPRHYGYHSPRFAGPPGYAAYPGGSGYGFAQGYRGRAGGSSYLDPCGNACISTP